MHLNALLLASAMAFCVGCPEATPYPFPLSEPLDDASPDSSPDASPDSSPDTSPVEDEPHVPRPDFELCELEGAEQLAEEEFMIQIRNPECSTTICLHYNLVTFCTWQCADDDDCRELDRGFCELEIFAGDTEMYGWYCVPSSASRQGGEED